MNESGTKIISDFVMSFIDKYGKTIYNAIKEKGKKEWKKFKVDINIAFNSYYQKSYEKYSRVKTVLYKTEPQPLYRFFEKPYLQKGDDPEFLVDNANSVLDISNFIIIRGTGGIGKSTLMKHLFICELKEKNLIPVFIELKDINSLNGDYDIIEFFFKKFNDIGGDFDLAAIEYSLSQGYFLFLLDGYDEIYSTQRDEFFKKFDAFCDRYPENSYVISSRPFDEFISLQRFTVLTAMPFTKEQAKSLIKHIPYDKDTKERFIKQLDIELYDKHKSFSSNPLLLSIMLLTFENYAEIPDKLHLFYANAFETLFEKHDATKSGYKREFRSKLPFDKFKKVFSMFCFVTYLKGKITFTRDQIFRFIEEVSKKTFSFNTEDFIYDLTNSLCVMHIDGTEYSFTHRSFQEYFTAFFLLNQPDEIYEKCGLELIHRDSRRAEKDSVFPMLRDMEEVRYERNILLPLLNEFEQNIGSMELYDLYFHKLVRDISYYTEPSMGDRLVLAYGIGDSMLFFCRRYLQYYDNDMYNRREAEAVAEKELLEYLTRNNCLYDTISQEDILADQTMYSLLRKTWIGHEVTNLSTFKETILKKQEKAAVDLDSILSLNV